MAALPKKIGVFAPSSYVEAADIEAAKILMRERGYEVQVHRQTLERDNQSAGTHTQKIAALHDLYRDSSIDVIWAAGGGNRALHILSDLDFDLIRANPKPMIGFSDVTALLNGISAKTGITNIHGPVFKQISDRHNLDDILSGNLTMPLDDAQVVRRGKAEGPLFGGNLSLFQYLLPDDAYDGAIVFLEDCHEELSRIDRMFLHLRRSGVFERASGLVFGQFTDLKDSARPFGFTLEEIVQEHTEGLDIPILMNAPFGHTKENYPFMIGAHAVLDTVSEQPTLISQSE